MSDHVCGICGSHAARVAVLTNAGIRYGICCPNHGVTSWEGYAPVAGLASAAGGVAGSYLGPGAGLADLQKLPPGGYANAPTGPFAGVWGIRPPTLNAPPIIVGNAYATVASSVDGTALSVLLPIQTPAWTGRLSNGVWYENPSA